MPFCVLVKIQYTRLVLIEILLQFLQTVDMNFSERRGHSKVSERQFPVISQLRNINIDELRNSILLNHEPLDPILSS